MANGDHGQSMASVPNPAKVESRKEVEIARVPSMEGNVKVTKSGRSLATPNPALRGQTGGRGEIVPPAVAGGPR